MNSLYVRLAIAFGSVVLGVVLGAMHVFEGGNWLAAGSIFGSSILVAIGIVMGPEFLKEHLGVALLGILVSAMGIGHFAFETNGMNIERQAVQNALMMRFHELAADPYNKWRLIPAERKIAENGFRICLMSGPRDMQESLTEAQKNIYFGPGMSLLDETQSRLNSESKRGTCLDHYRQLKKTQPMAFHQMDRQYAEFLQSRRAQH